MCSSDLKETVEDITAIVNKYKIKKLLSVNLDKEKMEEEKNWVTEKLKDVDGYSIENYKDLLKMIKKEKK